MKIKNIQTFRNEWKQQQGYGMDNWDENFIGSTHGEKSGFYKMVNGIVNNIRADLVPKLQNAQDDQAIYEFFQNAADCQSTECAIIYDENFFMVINNGNPFSANDLKAILNSFQGTKADKNKDENKDKIGRYGIGFKLAYRLLGKSDGVEELLDQNAGPIIFSWFNQSQFNDLTQLENLKSIELTNDINETNGSPWLLKTVLACFPSLPNEKIKDINYKDTVAFNENELYDLINFLKKHENLISNLAKEKGSLFFLKFGTKKHEKLLNSLINIKSGIGYSLNTLKTLKKVILQDEIIEKYQVETERFEIEPNTDEFKRINPEFPQIPIELIFGYPTDTNEAFKLKKAPSIYQFFPMRNEQHNWAFFVHGTSFAKITDRTRLDDQGEANHETFQYLNQALIEKLENYKLSDFQKFTKIYKVLLLSDSSDKYNNELINNYFYKPLLEYIKNNIPTKKQNIYTKDLVIVKKTALPVEPMQFGIGKEWFFWDNIETEKNIQKEAADKDKLSLTRWGLKELILEGTSSLINSWLRSLNETNYQLFIDELKKIKGDDKFNTKLSDIECFKFKDAKGKTSFFTLNGLRNSENTFLLNEHTVSLKEELQHLGFNVLEFNIQEYSRILNDLENKLHYLTNAEALLNKILKRIEKSRLKATHKINIFNTLRKIDGINLKRLTEIPLFTDTQQQTRPLTALIAGKMEVAPWLENFKITPEEETEELNEFMISTEKPELMFTNIIQNYWDEIVKNTDAKQAPDAFYADIKNYYKLKTAIPKISEKNYVFIDDETGFVNNEQIFYHPKLAEIESYEALKQAIKKLTNRNLPPKELLHFLTEAPFKATITTAQKEWKKEWKTIESCIPGANLSAQEKSTFFELMQKVFDKATIENIALFTDQKGNFKKLRELIHSKSEVEYWLSTFKINEQEYSENLTPFFIDEKTIYGSIIQPQWEKIVAENIEKIQNNKTEFYDQVIKYFTVGKAIKTLNTQNYILTENQFVSGKEAFYHEKLDTVENYPALSQAITKLTGLSLPVPEILPFLKEKPVKTNNQLFKKFVTDGDVILEKSEIIELQRFLDTINEDIFTYLYIEATENPVEFKVGAKTHFVQYHLGRNKEEISKKIAQTFEGRYKELPHSIYISELRNRNLRQGTDLFQELSTSGDEELLSTILVGENNREIQSHVFNQLEEIRLEQGKIYDGESFEHRAMQVFRGKDVDYEELREKIYIQNTEGTVYKLTEIGFNEKISFQFERQGKFELELSKILPRFVKINEMLDEICSQFTDFEAPTILQRKVFHSADELNHQILSDELEKTYPLCENDSQLAFNILFAKETNTNRRLNNFTINTHAGERKIIDLETIYTQEIPFIKSEIILDSNYENIADLLKLKDKNYFEFNDHKIAEAPYFERNEFYIDAINIDEKNDELKIQLFDYLFEKWQSNQQPFIQLFIDNQASSKLLDIQFNKLVYPEHFALENEGLPHPINQWLDENTDEKIIFLTALGVNTTKTSLVELRNYLAFNEGEISRRHLNELSGNKSKHLINSLRWLMQNDIEFTTNDERISWLKSLYNKLEEQKIPLLYIAKIEGEQFIYKIDNFSEKKLYFFNENKQNQLENDYNISIKHVFDCLQNDNQYFTNIELKNIDLPTTKITEELEISELAENSYEWTADYYLQWKEENEYEIRLYNGKIPYSIHFLNKKINQFTKGNAILSDNTIFVNSESQNIENELFEIVSNTGLTEKQLLQLLRYKNAPQKNNELQIEHIEENNIEKIHERLSEKNEKLRLQIDFEDLPDDVIMQLDELLKYGKNIKILK